MKPKEERKVVPEDSDFLLPVVDTGAGQEKEVHALLVFPETDECLQEGAAAEGLRCLRVTFKAPDNFYELRGRRARNPLMCLSITG